MKRATCTHIVRGKETLMAFQQFKIIGLKGYGGVINDGEGAMESAVREILEETGGDPQRRINPVEAGGITVLPADLEPIGLIDFYNGDETEVPFGDPSFRVLFLKAKKFTGRAVSTKEMINPGWYSIVPGKMPIGEMPPGDDLFIPRILNGERLTGWVRRTKDFKRILGHGLRSCDLEDLVI